MEFRAGENVDKYTLVEGLGKGGQGTVWKVIDQLDRSLKAVKFIDLAQLPTTAVERARREAKAVTELRDHPAIVPCHVLFDLPGKDLLGLVFDLVPGTALAHLMNDPRMTPQHRVAVLRQIASALAHVHSRGLVHRDIKPANVIVTEAFWSAPDEPGTIKLVDFGIVAPVNDAKRITVEHHPVGTAPYLAPELLLPSRWPSPPESFTQDIFAFGVLGFDLLSGMHPTGLPILAKRPTFANAYQAADEGRLRWPTYPLNHALAPILQRCLVLDPNLRIASGTELAVALGLETPPRSAPRAPAPSAPQLAPTADPRWAPTASHVDLRSSSAASTAMGYGPAQQRQARRAYREHEPVPAPPLEKRTHWIVAALAVLVLVAVVFWQLGRSGATPDGNTVTNTFPSPRADSAPNSTSSLEEKPCCPPSGGCKTEWPCGPGKCDARMPNRWYYLRLTGVAGHAASDLGKFDSFSDDYAASHPRARVCVRRANTAEQATCSLLTDIAATNSGDRKKRAHVSTADINNGGLEIWVEENGVSLVRGQTGQPDKGPFLITGLCDGIKLYLGSKATSPIRIGAYLDPG